MIGLPGVPFDPAPASVFTDSNGGAIDIEGSVPLYRFIQGYGYSFYYDDPAAYGGMLLGDGHWVRNASASSITWTYEGAPSGLPDATTNAGTDMWISLPVAGTTQIGFPFASPVQVANCMFTDGTQTISWDAAANLGWFDGFAWGFTNGFGYIQIGTDPDSYNSTQFDPYNGYLINTSMDNLAIIIPAPAS
jgi:hypothetical protein